MEISGDEMTNKIRKAKISSNSPSRLLADCLNIDYCALVILDYIRRPLSASTNGQVYNTFWRKK